MDLRKVGRRAPSATTERQYRCDYLNIPSRFPFILAILRKQGDQHVLFADKVFKITGSGKMKRHILLITEFAVYIVDPEASVLKRRIALTAIEKLCMSKLVDYFFAMVVPTEHDCLLASTRKMEIVSTMAEATKSSSTCKLEVTSSNGQV